MILVTRENWSLEPRSHNAATPSPKNLMSASFPLEKQSDHARMKAHL